MSALQPFMAKVAHLRGHPEADRCPWCDQDIPNEKRDEIERRIAAREQDLERETAARLQEQFAREKRESDAKSKAEIEALKASLAGAVKAREDEVKAALEKDKAAALLAEQTKAFEERQKFQSKIAELQRQLENKTAQDLGEGAEADLFEMLKAEFPEDRISRVEKGAAGADIIHDIHHNGHYCGRIVYDAKNRSAWRNEYVSKLRQDQTDANADHAVLASKVFPAGVRELYIQDGVLIVAPQRSLVVAALLRRHILQTHTLRLSNDARAEKTAALYAFIMSERCAQLLSSIETHADDLVDLDRKEERSHQLTWKRRAELIRAVQRSRDDLSSQIERIIGTRSADRAG